MEKTSDLNLKISTKKKSSFNQKSKSTTSSENEIEIIEIDDFYVEKILDMRTDRRGRKEYLVKWENFESDQNSWEPAKNFETCRWKVEEYENSLKPASLKSYSSSKEMSKSNIRERSTYMSCETDDESDHSNFEVDVAIQDDIPLGFSILASVPESKELEKILRVAPIDGVLTFLVQWKENGFEGNNGQSPLTSKNTSMVRAPAINAKFPQQVIQFYQDMVHWKNITTTKEEERQKVERAIKQAQERQAALNNTKPSESIDNDGDDDPAAAAIEREKRKRDRFNVHESDLSSSDSDDCLVKSSSDEKEDNDYKEDKKKKITGRKKKKCLKL